MSTLTNVTWFIECEIIHLKTQEDIKVKYGEYSITLYPSNRKDTNSKWASTKIRVDRSYPLNFEKPWDDIRMVFNKWLDTIYTISPHISTRSHMIVDYDLDYENKTELIQQGYGSTKMSSNVNHDPTLSQDQLPIILQNVDIIGNGPQWIQNVISFNREAWFREIGPIRLLLLWTAFELIYHKTTEKEDRFVQEVSLIRKFFNNLFEKERINSLVEQQSSEDSPVNSSLLTSLNPHRNIFEYLISLNLKNRDGINRSDRLNTAVSRSSQNNREILCRTMLCIYEIRNNISHGKYDRSQMEQILFDPISKFLSDLLNLVIHWYFKNNT